MTGKELDAAAKAANDNTNVKVKLKKPITYDDVEYTELEFDFDKLTGNDGIKIERELERLGHPVAVPAYSGDYMIILAAKACTSSVGADFFRLLSIGDYNRVRSAMRNFLMRSEWL